MIASLRGVILSSASGQLVVEVGGVGYLVSVINKLASELSVGDSVLLHTSMIVREDSQTLFGFDTKEDLTVFDLLRSVSGVGPKSALAILGELSLADIAAAVARDDDSAFRRVSGIGPKTAKLITVSLAGKMNTFSGATALTQEAISETQGNHDSKSIEQARSAVIEALLGLGYQERSVAPVVADVANELSSGNRNELLRAALNRLGTSKSIAGGGEQ